MTKSKTSIYSWVLQKVLSVLILQWVVGNLYKTELERIKENYTVYKAMCLKRTKKNWKQILLEFNIMLKMKKMSELARKRWIGPLDHRMQNFCIT